MMDKDFIAEVSKVSAYIQSFTKDCIAYNFRLVKIKLPPEFFTLLRIQNINQADSRLEKSCGDITAELCGIPVEEDWTLTQPRYVIEVDGFEVL